ncbi:Eco57I restriction-modification methylase domain-containing protein, partial [Oscillochloris sp. ZM17-4]|uniref:Eco57I restriction-modification methylase domain-containing protein n=1 Tax=Oscillochloris sp. ZM17-4 TaxID=2866714 RepID=UPI001C73A306
EVFIDLHTRAWKPAEQMGFDAVVGNPPYLSGRDLGNLELKNYFASTFELVTYQADLYQLFMEKALYLINQRGIHSFIVPNTWTQAIYSEKLRRAILEKFSLLSITDFPVAVFSEASVDTLTYSVKPVYPLPDSAVKVFVFSSISLQSHHYQDIPQNSFLTNSSARIDFAASNDIRCLLDKIAVQAVSVDTIFETVRGINAYDKARGQTKAIIENRVYHSEMRKDDTFEPLLLGENIARYESLWSKKSWISYGPWLAAPRERRFFESNKILVRKILSGSRIVAYCDDDRYFVDQQLYIGVYRSDRSVSLYYACAVINSKMISFHHVNKYREKDILFPQITVGAFGDFPIRRIAFTTPAAQRAALLSEAVALHERGPLRAIEMAAPEPTAGRPPARSGAGDRAGGRPAAGPQEATSAAEAGGPMGGWRAWRERWAALWAWADARLPQGADGAPDTANEQSDAVHDLLAHLAERMIALHKQKQAGAAAFTGWLEEETGSAIEGWTLKTVINSFWEQPWEEIERAIQKNRGKLMQSAGLRGKAADAALLPLLRAARGRWATASADLAPTLAAIIATDRLIDLIV